MKRFFTLFITMFALMACTQTAIAGEKFDVAEFETQLSAGKPILVVAHAPWCPTCRAQESALKGIYANNTYKEISYLVIDFDNQKAICSAMSRSAPSRLMVQT